MKVTHKKHLWYYGILVFALLFGLYLLWITGYSKQLQMLIIVIISFFYVAWALLHHVLHHDLTVKIVVEYVLIGAMGMSVCLLLVR